MATIYDLADIGESLFTGLQAIRMGKADIGQQRLKMARDMMADTDVASQTRARIVQTQQSQGLFPSKLIGEQEAAKQAQQKTTSGALGLEREQKSWDDYLALRKLMKEKYKIDLDPEDYAKAQGFIREAKVGELRLTPESVSAEAGMLEQATTTATETGKLAEKQAITGQELEPGRKLTLAEQQKADFETARLTRETSYQAFINQLPQIIAKAKAKSIPLESQIAIQKLVLQAEEIKARIAEATNAAVKNQLQAEALQVEKDIEKAFPGYRFYKEFVSSGAVPRRDEITSQITTLEAAKARIQTAASLADAIREVAAEQKLDPNVTKTMTDLIKENNPGAMQRAFTTANDKTAALEILDSHIKLLKDMADFILPSYQMFPERPDPKSYTEEERQRIIDENRRLFPNK